MSTLPITACAPSDPSAKAITSITQALRKWQGSGIYYAGTVDEDYQLKPVYELANAVSCADVLLDPRDIVHLLRIASCASKGPADPGNPLEASGLADDIAEAWDALGPEWKALID